MNLQLLSLAIYDGRGRRRAVSFEPGRLNIITGRSLTGKTALIGIVDYCLGRKEFVVKGAAITDHVAWYVLHCQLPSGEAVLGRPAPRGTAATSAAYLKTGSSLTLPAFDELRPNTDTDGLRGFLTEAVGISGNENVPPEGQSRGSLRANIKHAKFLLFQPQTLIADGELLFYRQKEQQIPLAIRDTLPYFLGAVGEDQYARRQELRELRRRLKLRRQRLDDERAVAGREADRALALLAEARQSGLTVAAGDADDFAGAVELLRPLAVARPALPDVPTDDAFAELTAERNVLLARQGELAGEIEAARAYAGAGEEFSGEAKVQRDRLSAVDLFRRHDAAGVCPVCESELGRSVPKADQIRDNLEDLNRQLTAVARQRPRLEEFLRRRGEALSDVRTRLRENRVAVEALTARQSALRERQDLLLEQARVAGRIDLFLESVSEVAEDGRLPREIDDLEKQVEDLEEGLSEDAVDEQLASRLQVVAADLTEWARHLKLEHSEHPLGFDPRKLDVVAYRPTGPFPLSKMGGGKNAMGYHVTFLLALHKFFREQDRPVPALLMLDQPTQVYYPPDEEVEDRSVDDLDEGDRESVRKLFKLLHSVAEKLFPRLQIIVTDHADLLDEKWFQDSVVEKWRGGKKLVPTSWLDGESGDPPAEARDDDGAGGA